MTFGIDASHGYERIHETALVDVARLLVSYAESDVEISRDAQAAGAARLHPPASIDLAKPSAT